MVVYLRDGSDQTIVRAATLRSKMHIILATSPNHSILTPGQPVPALTKAIECKRKLLLRFKRQQPDREPQEYQFLSHWYDSIWKKIRGERGNRTWSATLTPYHEDGLVGLVVKASASRAEGPGFESRLPRDFFGVESYQ